MDALSFLDKVGTAKAAVVAEKAGTSYKYFQQIAYGHYIPSRDLAIKLARASRGEMQPMELLFPPTRRFRDGRPRRGKLTRKGRNGTKG